MPFRILKIKFPKGAWRSHFCTGKIALERKKKGIKKHILVKLCNKQNILKKSKGGITYVLDS